MSDIPVEAAKSKHKRFKFTYSHQYQPEYSLEFTVEHGDMLHAAMVAKEKSEGMTDGPWVMDECKQVPYTEGVHYEERTS